MASADYRAGARVLARMGSVPRCRCVLSAITRAGRFCEDRARPDHHPQPSRRFDAGRALRQPGRGGAGDLATRHRGGGRVSQRQPQAGRHRHAAAWASIGIPRASRSARKSWPRRWLRSSATASSSSVPTAACSRATSQSIRCRSPITSCSTRFKRFSKSYSAPERAALLHDTAVRTYRIANDG